MTPQKFRNIVWKYYAEHGRHTLPWRKSYNPYKVLISEMMLQQTQVERVIPYFKAWMKKYPSVRALAKAPLADVLRQWQGLGYNRRAKFLHGAAKEIVATYNGKIPEDAAILESIWGIGSYTARAIVTFAYNHDAIVLETNTRTAITHHFFADRESVSDEDVSHMLKKVLPHGRSREWYSALMDYGAYLKRSGVRINAKSKGYSKQSTFKGSGRKARGALLRHLTKGPEGKMKLMKLLPNERKDQLEEQLQKLVKEGMVERSRSVYRLPQ
jgi:A/G-specific adenine glycosylase